MITLELPLRLISEGNSHTHWREVHRRRASQRFAVWASLKEIKAEIPLSNGIQVTLTRIAPRSLDTHDNLPMSFKAVVDGIAQFLGVADNDHRITWTYAQSKGFPRQYGLHIAITARDPP